MAEDTDFDALFAEVMKDPVARAAYEENERSMWRRRPKVCRARYGASNTARYRSVTITQPPMRLLGDTIQLWTALGTVPYAGALRSTIYTTHGLKLRRFGPYMVPEWHWDKLPDAAALEQEEKDDG